MNSIRKFLGLVMAALVLGAFALPANCCAKQPDFTQHRPPLPGLGGTLRSLGHVKFNSVPAGSSFELDITRHPTFKVTACYLGSLVTGNCHS